MSFHNIKVGDSVYVRRSWFRASERGRHELVTSVVPRSKGFYIGTDRFDMTTGKQTNGRTSQSQCWLSEFTYDEAKRLERLWIVFRGRLPHSPPVSVERIHELAAEFGMAPIVIEEPK